MKVEVCANSLASALAAQQGGADRIELCSELAVGGVTPSAGLLREVRRQVELPVHVLIRPRSGDFCYSEEDFQIILNDIALCVEWGFEGIVCGCLLPDGRMDADRTARLRDAIPGHFTFHRAFDQCPEPEAAAALLDRLGVDTLLSSGQAANAVEGLPLLEQLQGSVKRLQLMPGGGIGPSNISKFSHSGFGAVHLSATSGFTARDAVYGPPMNTPGMLTEGPPPVSDAALVRRVVKALDSA